MSENYKKTKENTPLNIQIKVLEDLLKIEKSEVKRLTEQLKLCEVMKQSEQLKEKNDRLSELGTEQLIECYDCVFTSVHSGGFKSAEMKDLITDKGYRFLERPKEGWENALRTKLNELGFELDDLRM